MKIKKSTIFKVIAVVFIIYYIVVTEKIPWRTGSLLAIYDAEDLNIDTSSYYYNNEGNPTYENLLEGENIDIIYEFLNLDWKPKYFNTNAQKTESSTIHIGFADSDVFFVIDLINDKEIEVNAHGIPPYRNSFVTYQVKHGYDIDKLKSAFSAN